jgi:hypothetical protein
VGKRQVCEGFWKLTALSLGPLLKRGWSGMVGGGIGQDVLYYTICILYTICLYASPSHQKRRQRKCGNSYMPMMQVLICAPKSSAHGRWNNMEYIYIYIIWNTYIYNMEYIYI